MAISIHIDEGLVDSYRFSSRALLRQALTHKSVNRPAPLNESGNYERLEFLGDSILGLIVSEYLWRKFPDKPEGELSRFRAQLVNEDALANVARNIQLNRFIVLGNGEREAGGHEKESILADVFEALVGALYIDGGLEVARRFVETSLAENLHTVAIARAVTDFKTELQELLQSESLSLPVYRLISESGPAHNRVFEVEVLIAGQSFGCGVGSSKKRAEQVAAGRALEFLAANPQVLNTPSRRQEIHYA